MNNCWLLCLDRGAVPDVKRSDIKGFRAVDADAHELDAESRYNA